MKKKIRNEVEQYIIDNYGTLSNKELCENLRALYPNDEITIYTPRFILFKNKLKRTKEERSFLMEKLVAAGVKRDAVIKQHKDSGKGKKVGDLFWSRYSNSKEKILLIYLGVRKWKPYKIWLWEQTYGKVPNTHCIILKDPNAPITIDNLEMIKKGAPTKFKIGDILIWKRLGVYREYIKTGPDKYELYMPYLWKLNGREIPPGQYVTKKDPNAPTTIDNLECRLVESGIVVGNRTLPEWVLLNHCTKSKEIKEHLKQMPEVLAVIKKNIQLKKQAKEYARKSENNELEGTSSENGE